MQKVTRVLYAHARVCVCVFALLIACSFLTTSKTYTFTDRRLYTKKKQGIHAHHEMCIFLIFLLLSWPTLCCCYDVCCCCCYYCWSSQSRNLLSCKIFYLVNNRKRRLASRQYSYWAASFFHILCSLDAFYFFSSFYLFSKVMRI